MVPRPRRSSLTGIGVPALPGWADVLRSALRALAFAPFVQVSVASLVELWRPSIWGVRSLTVLSEEHPDDQAEQGGEKDQQEAAQHQRHCALLLRLRLGDAEGSDEALHQKIQQFHDVSQYLPRQHWRLLLMLIPLSPDAGRRAA